MQQLILKTRQRGFRHDLFLLDELNKYVYEHPEYYGGKTINRYDLDLDHGVDALRYAAMDFGRKIQELSWWKRLWNRFISFLHSFFMGNDTTPTQPSGGCIGCDPSNGDAKQDMYAKPPERLYNFSDALEMLKQGMAITRKGWNGKSMYLRLQRGDRFSKMTLPYIYIVTPSRTHITGLDRCPWLASQTDLLSEDWSIVSPE